ncbi:MAG: bifunctional diaminohydroxyphosphoribosylaminopyrimidine deaminase/5-amino-6-(5-phosphoribosylamino)uracil reductase RibD [Synergistaceae bacterium]|nr:bifunctional diaminohydroxyphosphoribosylaminopyrimidine deaminase/5-amino-6-(5-phosphoribosylamino)uracil reductase RibD [Synergistaceae bacterium]
MTVNERSIHEYYMRMALSFARRGTGYVSPNPRVGCVIVDFSVPGGRVVSYGYHKEYGGPHAEVNAMGAAKEPVAGMTVYVNLEPCCHTGHTAPCCDALIAGGISCVVAGVSDPDPRVSGGGSARLAAAGVKVLSPVLENECRYINRGFIKRVTKGVPWVTIKAAISLDGDIALADGESKWITGAPARRVAHMMRADSDVIMAGSGTVMKDDPALSVRDTDGRSPMKAIVDRNLDIPPLAGVLDGSCVIFTDTSACAKKAAELEKRGARVVRIGTDDGGHIPPGDMLSELAAMGANYVMIEGGAGLISSFLSSGEADEIALFEAPKLMGGGIGVTGGLLVKSMNDALPVKNIRIRRLGADLLLRGVTPCSPGL